MREFKDIPDIDEVSPESLRRAKLKVADMASSKDDALTILQMLGLSSYEAVAEDPKYSRLCRKGLHRMTEDNTFDERKCVACKEKEDLVRVKKRKQNTHCVNGHERTPENTHIEPSMNHRCLPCRRESAKKYAKSRPPRNQRPLGCKYGHAWPEEVKRDARGARVCQVCTEARKKVDS